MPERALSRGEAAARGEWLAIAALVVLALALRLWNLGALSLVGDEGHQALAVQGILASGYPLLPSDTIYLRGAPFIYAEALVARLTGAVTPFGLRLPSAVFGALAVGLVFALARRMWGNRVAFIATDPTVRTPQVYIIDVGGPTPGAAVHRAGGAHSDMSRLSRM